MARKDWEIRYKKSEMGGETPVYRNKKTGQHIMIGGKQLGAFDNFQQEKYPFEVEESGYSVRREKWFSKREDAIAYLRRYMRTH